MTEEWEDQAACRGMATSLFFPHCNENTHEPLGVCEGCPVRDACLEANLHEEHGIWGGTTARDRRRIRRQRRRERAA